MAKLKIEILTPEKTAFTGEADLVVLPGVDGEIGILPQHIPLVTKIIPGELMISNNSKQEFLAVGDGFAEITGYSVSVLTDMAIEESEIDTNAVEKALQRAEQAMSEKLPPDEKAALEAAISKSLAQLNLKRRRI